jgi:hypothetical protein
MHEGGAMSADVDLIPSAGDLTVIRGLAARWAELAADPCMVVRKRQWRALHDLRPERPMILFETGTVDGYVSPDEIQCVHPILRAVEATMREAIRHAEEIGDDIVLEPYYRIGWDLDDSGFGVEVITEPAAATGDGPSIGYTFNFPIRTPSETALLRPRTFSVNRERTLARKQLLEDAFGDLLPVRVGNYDHFMVEQGAESWAGNFFVGLTWQVYRFIGNDGLLYWLYDAPEAIHELLEYMVNDRTRMFEFIEREGLIVPNTDSQLAGPRAYGYVSDLPPADREGPATLKDLWCWADSQESSAISPAMFRDFVLPYLARVTSRFGLVYYGCCEAVHDRLEMVMDAMPNLRSVSVSPWSDFARVAEMLGRDYVFSRKPNAAFLSGPNPDWDLVRRDLDQTWAAASGGNVEFLYRDLYAINGDRARLARWVSLARSIVGA